MYTVFKSAIVLAQGLPEKPTREANNAQETVCEAPKKGKKKRKISVGLF
jgi:hypothetical protein